MSTIIRSVTSHYIGEPLQTTVLSARHKVEALKALWPLFGVDSTVKIPRSKEHFSLGFEENYHQLSWIDTNNLGKLRVTFLYSRSGDGVIASISSQPQMKTINEEYSTHLVDVEYWWLEDQPVSLSSGSIVMFLSTLVVSIWLALSLCGFAHEDNNPEPLEGNESPNMLRERGHMILHYE
jgi:hypothetical protein